MSTQTIPIPSAAANEATLLALFGNKQAASPVPAMYVALKQALATITANVDNAVANALSAWQDALAANPDYLLSPTTVTYWGPLLTVVTAFNNLTPVQAALSNYAAAISSWYLANQGSLAPASVPAIPAVLQPYGG